MGLALRDKWRLERVLGRGGMATVYLARHEIGRYDAIKILHDEYADDEHIRARFEREARAVNHFLHPGAVEIRDIDVTEDGVPFLVMEYLVGEPLGERMKRDPPGQDEILRIAIDVLDVLGAAHEQNIIHRDIKPANLFILEDGRIKVLDFGIARMREAAGGNSITQEGALLGTGPYMPPEQIMGEEIDHRADLFALGATLFRMLSGRTVHRAPSHSQLLVRMATEPAPKLGTVAPHVPVELQHVVDLSLGIHPDGRYPDAPTMQRDLQAVRHGEPPPFVSAIRAGDMEGAELARTAARASRDSSGRGTASSARPRRSSAQRMTGQLLRGRYRLEKLIGKGGMGAVYEATDLQSSGQVAIKLVLAHLALSDSSAPGRFRREAQAAAAIDNPHAVRVRDADVDENGTPFLVMDLLRGRDLERWLDRVRPLDQEGAKRLFLQACMGIAAAHERDIVHRDVKPANLFISREPHGELVVKVLDFGLAKQRSATPQASLTETGGVLGTPRYASPEQVKNAKLVDKKSDVWSLCMTMYEALSGVVPWSECEAVGEIIIAIATTDVTPIREVAPWVKPELAAIIDRGLSRDPAQRWEDAPALVRALKPLVPDPTLDEGMLAGRTGVPAHAGGPSSLRSFPGVGASTAPPHKSRAPMWVALVAVLVGIGSAYALLREAPVAETSAPAARPVPVEPEPAVSPSPQPPPTVVPAEPSTTASREPTPQPKTVAPRPATQNPTPKPSAAPPKPTSRQTPDPPPKLELKREW